MALADPTPAFRGYQDEVWELMRGGHPLGGVEDAIEQTEVGEDRKVALWLLAFSLSDPEQAPDDGLRGRDEPLQGAARGRHLSLVTDPLR
jgi:hypothetical protein